MSRARVEDTRFYTDVSKKHLDPYFLRNNVYVLIAQLIWGTVEKVSFRCPRAREGEVGNEKKNLMLLSDIKPHFFVSLIQSTFDSVRACVIPYSR